MAIQMRRGQLADYDKNKMLAGEWGIAIDSDTERQKAFIAFGPGIDKEVLFVEDVKGQITEAIESATEEAEAWAHGDKFDTREYFSGDGTTTSFTLAYEPSSISGVFVDNARTTYTRSGKTITLATAPQSSSNNVRVDYTVNVSTDNAKYYKDSAQSSAYNAEVNASAAQTASNTAVQKAGEASNSASQAQSSASTATSKASTATSAASTATTKANQAASSASQASSQATAAGNYAKVAEAWAVGTKGGTDVPSTDPQYHNNAKYYADQMGTISSDVSNLKNDMTDVKNRLNTGLVVTDQGSGVVSISLA